MIQYVLPKHFECIIIHVCSGVRMRSVIVEVVLGFDSVRQ